MREALNDWYATNARDLPWRRPGTSAWAILVSEVMLQQTPVSRVQPAYLAWLARWPTPKDLAADTPAEAIRAWARLGYPRRALRLHTAATVITDRHNGDVPHRLPDLLALPGVGIYTAHAVAAFAFGQPQPVVDVNVRRVLARAVTGTAEPGPATSAADVALMAELLPSEPAEAVKFAAAVMECGATICTARNPACHACPIADGCAWHKAGSPQGAERRSRTQRYEGTDRQARGQILAALREATGAVTKEILHRTWRLDEQRERALAGLVTDGLVEKVSATEYALPGLFPSGR